MAKLAVKEKIIGFTFHFINTTIVLHISSLGVLSLANLKPTHIDFVFRCHVMFSNKMYI